MKNRIAISDKLILRRIDDQSFSPVAYLGFHSGEGFKIFLEKLGYLHGEATR